MAKYNGWMRAKINAVAAELRQTHGEGFARSFLEDFAIGTAEDPAVSIDCQPQDAAVTPPVDSGFAAPHTNRMRQK